MKIDVIMKIVLVLIWAGFALFFLGIAFPNLEYILGVLCAANAIYSALTSF